MEHPECTTYLPSSGVLTGEECGKAIHSRLKGWKLFYCNYNGDRQTRPNYFHKRYNLGTDYKKVREFVDKIANLAEEYSHYPHITFGLGFVYVKLYTDCFNTPTSWDITLGEKIDELYKTL